MDTITTAATIYTPPATSIVHQTSASMTDRAPSTPVHLTQYDTTMPVIEVALIANGQPYTVPSGAAVNVRLAKPDGTYVYNPALGVSEDAQTAYIGTTVQMTTVWGRLNAIVEVVLNGAVAGTGIFILDITANPVPASAIESTDEFLTIQEILAEAQAAAQIVQDNIDAIHAIPENVEKAQTAQELAENAYAFANDKAIQAAASATAAGNSATSAEESAAAAAQSAAQAAGSSQLAFYVDPVDGGLNCTVNLDDKEEPTS